MSIVSRILKRHFISIVPIPEFKTTFHLIFTISLRKQKIFQGPPANTVLKESTKLVLYYMSMSMFITHNLPQNKQVQ